MELQRPLVFVLTHGDGQTGASRLASTTRVLEGAGARVGPVYGRWRDADLYQALLDRRHTSLLQAVDEICQALDDEGIDCVVADAEERYNPSHDVCRYLADAVIARRSASGVPTSGLEFPLVAAPDALLATARPDGGAVVVHLHEAALARKLAAARGYPEMAGEVERALAAFGTAAFAIECLTPVHRSRFDETATPFYETHGAAQVAAGRYAAVLRYEQHVRPLRDSLAATAPGGRGAAGPGG